MVESEFYRILSFFLIYSCIGWGIEVAYQAITKGIIVNRGFLNGPVCPIYGFGAVAVLALLYVVNGGRPEEVNAVIVFVVGMCLATAVELIGGWLLDKLFHARWWDYRDRRFNLNGYICPEFSFYWGLGVLILVRVIHPCINRFLFLKPVLTVSGVMLVILYSVLAADIVISVAVIAGLNKKFAELDEIKRRMRIVSDSMSTKIGEDTLNGMKRVDHARVEMELAKAELRDDVQNVRETYHERRREIFSKLARHRHFGAGRLLFDNPTFLHNEYIQYIDEIRKEILAKYEPDHNEEEHR